MKCRFDPTRIERCLICENKCDTFIAWHQANEDTYSALARHYVDKYPDKYSMEVILMARKTPEPPLPATKPAGKLIAFVEEVDGQLIIRKLASYDDAKAGKLDPKEYDKKRLLGLTGIEYVPVLTVTLKQQKLTKL